MENTALTLATRGTSRATNRATTIKANFVATENPISKTEFIKMGANPFDYTPAVDIGSDDFNPTTIVFSVKKNNCGNLIENVTGKKH